MKLALKKHIYREKAKREIITKNLKILINYIKYKIVEKDIYSYSPHTNGKKYMVIIACHCDSEMKLNAISNNIKYFSFENVDKIIINSHGLPFNSHVEEICQKYNNTKYCEISNTGYCDYGKWIYAIKNLFNYNDYDYVVCTNDSYIINNKINHFFNLIDKYNTDLFGYNDSTQRGYHYQSYLFSLKKSAIPVLINEVSNPNLRINNLEDVVTNFELKMTNWFQNKQCFLSIGNCPFNRESNIFFENDKLYVQLLRTGLLPFTKIKRLI